MRKSGFKKITITEEYHDGQSQSWEIPFKFFGDDGTRFDTISADAKFSKDESVQITINAMVSKLVAGSNK
jgi:hypothetical protein